MRKYIILFFSSLLFFTSCKFDNTPDGIVKQDAMIAILTDIHIADGTLINKTQMPDTLYKYGSAKFASVFKYHHIDSALFRKSFAYYADQPELMDTIYVKVIRNIQHKSDSVNKILAKHNTHQDINFNGKTLFNKQVPNNHRPPVPQHLNKYGLPGK